MAGVTLRVSDTLPPELLPDDPPLLDVLLPEELPPEERSPGEAPLAVSPERQNEGIGSLLVEQGLRECREAGHPFVIVLGHSHYYPRFRFVPASRYNVTSEYDVRDEVFMIQELQQGSLLGIAGTAKYQNEFNEV